MLKFSVPVDDETRLEYPMAKTDHFLIGSAAEFVKKVSSLPRSMNMSYMERDPSFYGCNSFANAIAMARDGDLSAVAASDEYMSKLENLFPVPSSRHEIIDDVVGAFPNVPAYLAGQPLQMRRKRKMENEFAPLAVVVNIASSASVDAQLVRKRGTAILALVRALAARRPVELWVGVTAGSGDRKNRDASGSVYFRIETSPLDLAHAAHLITHPSVSRMLCYETLRQTLNTPSGIPWQYNESSDPQKIRRTFVQIMRRGFAHMNEVLAIPMIHIYDDALVDPVAWLKKMVATYGGILDTDE